MRRWLSSVLTATRAEVIDEPLGDERLTLGRRSVEAVVLVATDPVPTATLASVTGLPIGTVHRLCSELSADYRRADRGFELVEVAGGWRFQTVAELSHVVEAFVLDGEKVSMSAAAMETLAIVAYKQPISRAQIAAIRGVSVDGVLRTLMQRGVVAEVGKDDGPGQATLFGTTPLFLERLGLASLSQLPELGEFIPSAQVVEALETSLRVDPASDPPTETP